MYPRETTMDRRKFMKYGIGGIVGLGVVGAVLPESEGEDDSGKAKQEGQTPTSTPTETATPEPKETLQKGKIITPGDKLKVLSAETVEDSFAKKVTGVIQNVSGKELSYAQVRIVGFDENDVQLTEWMDNTTSFPAGGKWKFTVSFMTTGDSEVAYWKGETSTTPDL